MKLSETQKYDAAVLSVIGFYLLGLFFSYGYLQADEHFQIVEFGYYFLGENQASDLAWEFEAQIRPSLQPMIAAGIIQFNALFEKSDIYSIALSLRLITMLLSLSVLLKFANSQRSRFELVDTYLYYFISLGLWFILFFSFRFSSETWSGLLCLLAITFYYEKRALWLVGTFFGLSFLFRFQIAFLVLGFLLNLIVYRNLSVKQLLQVISPILLIMILGVVLDSLFYGSFTITPWNYLKFNILDSGASGFGELPWYYYFLFLLKKPMILLGIVILITFLANLYYHFKNPIVWGVVFFLFFHSIIPHKESRFLIPIAFFAPYFIFNALRQVKLKKVRSVTLVLMLFLNLLPLTVAALKSAGPGYVYLGKYINEKYGDKEVVIYSFPYSNPFYHWDKKVMNHYDIHHSEAHFVMDVYQLDKSFARVNFERTLDGDTVDVVQLLTIRDRELSEFKETDFYKITQPKYLSASHPEWILKILKWYNGFHYFEVVHLFELSADALDGEEEYYKQQQVSQD